MSQRNNSNGKRRNGKGRKRQNGKSKNRKNVVLLGDNEPQSYPFTTASHTVKKSIRFFAARVTSDASGNVNYRFSLRNPTRAINGAGTYTDVANLSTIYDTYKPMWFRVKLVPVFATSTFAVPSIVLCVDYEDNDLSQVVSTVADANQYEERKVIDPRYMTETIFKIPKLESGSIPGLTSTSPAVIQAGGFLDFNAPPYDGVVYMVGGGFPLNLGLFDVYLEMDILCKYSR